MIGEHHSSCVGEHCAYSRVSYRASCVHYVGFRTAVCVIRRPLFILGSHTTLLDTHYRLFQLFQLWVSTRCSLNSYPLSNSAHERPLRDPMPARLTPIRRMHTYVPPTPLPPTPTCLLRSTPMTTFAQTCAVIYQAAPTTTPNHPPPPPPTPPPPPPPPARLSVGFRDRFS